MTTKPPNEHAELGSELVEIIRANVYSAIVQALGNDRFDGEIAVEAAESILQAIRQHGDTGKWPLYTTCEPYLSGWRVTAGFSELADAQAFHASLRKPDASTCTSCEELVEALKIATPYIAGSYEDNLRIPRHKQNYEIANVAIANYTKRKPDAPKLMTEDEAVEIMALAAANLRRAKYNLPKLSISDVRRDEASSGIEEEARASYRALTAAQKKGK